MSDNSMSIVPAMRPSIAPHAQALMRGQVALWPKYEHVFYGTWDAATKQVTSVTHLGVGSKDTSKVLAGDFPPNTVAIHTHPHGDLEPSAADLEAMALLAQVHIGFAITSNKCDQLLLAREPRAPWQDPSDYRIRKFGRLTLLWKRKTPKLLPNPSTTVQQP